MNRNGALVDACYSEEMVYISGVINRRAKMLFFLKELNEKNKKH